MYDAPKFAFALIVSGIAALLGCAMSSAFLATVDVPAPARPWLWAVPYILLMAGALLIGWAIWEIGVNGIERVNYSRADYHVAKREEVEARTAIIPGVTNEFLTEWLSLSEAAPYPQRRYSDGSRERTMTGMIIAEMTHRGFAVMTANKGAVWEKGWTGSGAASELGVPPTPLPQDTPKKGISAFARTEN